jgi:hypothetical protein
MDDLRRSGRNRKNSRHDRSRIKVECVVTEDKSDECYIEQIFKLADDIKTVLVSVILSYSLSSLFLQRMRKISKLLPEKEAAAAFVY